MNHQEKFDTYYLHLNQISVVGKLYKRFLVAPLLYIAARTFGQHIAEIGTGIGSGLIGAFPQKVIGLEINPSAVNYCQKNGLNVQLIHDQHPYPLTNAALDVCVMDNVLEHLQDPSFTLDECARVTSDHGGLIVAVPGQKGYASDDDHKVFYDLSNLPKLHPSWQLSYTFSTPFLIKSDWLSRHVRQYCLIAVYKKSSHID